MSFTILSLVTANAFLINDGIGTPSFSKFSQILISSITIKYIEIPLTSIVDTLRPTMKISPTNNVAISPIFLPNNEVQKVYYKLTLDANGGYFATESETVFKALAVAGEPILHLPSDTVTSLDPIKVFDQWYYDSDCTEPLGAALSEFVPTGDVTLYAGYEKIKINVADCEVSLTPQSYVYDGRKKEPKVTVSYEGETLNAQTDYTVTYKNNSNAGKGKVTIVGTGDYEGETTLEFTIGKADAVLNFAEKSAIEKKHNDNDQQRRENGRNQNSNDRRMKNNNGGKFNGRISEDGEYDDYSYGRKKKKKSTYIAQPVVEQVITDVRFG